jgi:hypothetical protein
MLSFNFDTPLEEYSCDGRSVYVKRDDLLNGDMDLPPWAKMEGIRRVLESGDLNKDIPIIHLSIRVSYSGWALAYIGRELGFNIKIAYPNTKDYPKKALEKIESLGAELVPMKPNLLSIVISGVGILARERGYQMMPYAFNHTEYIEYFRERTQEIMQERDFKHLVINAGSGVTSSGILQGFMNFDTFGPHDEENKKYAHLITTASKSSIISMLKKWGVYDYNQTRIHETPHDFFDDMNNLHTDFPCNGNWDKKAWAWLQENARNLDGDVLFYNLGGHSASYFWKTQNEKILLREEQPNRV